MYSEQCSGKPKSYYFFEFYHLLSYLMDESIFFLKENYIKTLFICLRIFFRPTILLKVYYIEEVSFFGICNLSYILMFLLTKRLTT